MMRKLMFALTVAAGVGVAAGCKDSGPTPMKFDASKAGYGNQGQYTKGAGTGGTQTTTTTTE